MYVIGEASGNTRLLVVKISGGQNLYFNFLQHDWVGAPNPHFVQGQLYSLNGYIQMLMNISKEVSKFY